MTSTLPQENTVGIVLAAGNGSRMRSKIPKPLHRVAGKELVRFSVELMLSCGVNEIVVVTSPANTAEIAGVLGNGVTYAVQQTPRGTADAVACGLNALTAVPQTVVVMAGDTPLVRENSLSQLIADHVADRERRMTILSAPDAFGPDLGHLIRTDRGDTRSVGPVASISEAAERQADESLPAEVNTGVYCFRGEWLRQYVDCVQPGSTGELYLTALPELAAAGGLGGVMAAPFAWADEAMGVNDRQQLAAASVVLRDRINSQWMLNGVTIVDPATTYIDSDVVIGPDTVVLPNTTLSGSSAIGEDCEIGPNSVIADCLIGDGCRVVASVLEDATMHPNVTIGPFSHLRPGAVIESGVHLGNYVEVKNSRIGSGAAAGHFCYLGDADIGSGVNIGAGTITCNYDGLDKHRTTIGDGAFIGSDTMLIAPVSVGKHAATGAGAVVTRDVPDAGRVVGVPARLLPSPTRERD